MRGTRFQFGLRTLFVVLTAAAVLAWSHKYGRPLYDDWQTTRRFRAALRAGDPQAFVLSLQRLEAMLARRPDNQRLLESESDLPQPLAVDQGLANECRELLESPSAKVRVLATLSVGLIRRDPASEVPRLAALLSDPSADVRAMAAHVLKCYGDDARPVLPDLVKLIKAKGTGSDRTAALDTLVKLDSHAAMEATGSGGIFWSSQSLGWRPSECADHFLEELYPGYRRSSDVFEQQFVDTELAYWQEELAVAVDAERRKRCQEEVDKMESYLQVIRSKPAEGNGQADKAQ